MVNSKQRGFVIPLGLFLLLGLSITAFAVASTGFFQEKMAGITKAMTDDFFDAETAVKQQENTFAALTDLTGVTLLDSECGIGEIVENAGGVTIRTTYINPPPNGVNWGSGDGSKVLICHMFKNELIISVNAVGDDGSKHSGHTGDYLGQCINGSLAVPDDAWVTCEQKFGTDAKRLSWQQLWDI
ncbi:MAG: hypothetical protein HOE99_08735 [Acidiferrobacteraceae bacterium]|nr:hypothetical protein [Acidiferrobacteraceae bacterium]MBT3973883.1 hypothetical protein [Acidiferrobacteraceae bacterium]MBT5981357.1 hypothetical protein [Acidiferrobacteraceae bacterium]